MSRAAPIIAFVISHAVGLEEERDDEEEEEEEKEEEGLETIGPPIFQRI